MASIVMLPGCGGGGGSSNPSPSPSPVLSPSPSPSPVPSVTPSPVPSPSPSPAIQVAIQPSTLTLAPSTQQQFTGTVANTSNPTISWVVGEGASGGAVNDAGLYTAPALAGVYHVIARSVADATQSASATITVPIVVTVSPATVTTVSQPVTFTGSVNVSQNQSVTWRVQEGDGGGTITQGGIYTPPGLGGVFHVVATSTADGTTQGIATVNVPSGGASGVIQ